MTNLVLTTTVKKKKKLISTFFSNYNSKRLIEPLSTTIKMYRTNNVTEMI